MNNEMKEKAIKHAKEGIDKFSNLNDIAKYVKDKFDNLDGGPWVSLVSNNFYSADVAYNLKYFINFKVGEYYFVLFRVCNLKRAVQFS